MIKHQKLRFSEEPLNVGNDKVIVVTSASGAARAYYADGVEFKTSDRKGMLVDSDKATWKVTESELIKTGSKTRLKRYPSHQSFWFGWHAQFPKTRLIK